MKIDNNKISIFIILLLLALIIYYISKNWKTTRIPVASDPFVETSADNDDLVLTDDDLVLNDDDFSVTTSGCCEGVAYNYDPACLTDPNCNCDMSLCTSPPPVWSTCYGACNSGYTSLYTIDTCGSGQATNYPFTQAPYCQNNQN